MTKVLTVLIVEDVENDALLLVRMLKRSGYQVASERVENAAEMQSALEKQAWDIVISDYNLPQFDGLAALRLLQEKEIDIPFIVVSGTIGEETAVMIMKAGAHDYLMKDNLSRLAPAVERELSQANVRREQKRNEEQLRQLSRAVEFSPTSIVMTDLNGNIEYVNPKFTAITGYELEEVRGQTLRALKSGKTDPEVYENLWRTILSGKEWYGEMLNCKKDGTFFWENISISAISDSKNNITHFVAVNEDITARKEAQEKIQQLNAELERMAMTDYLTNVYNLRYFMQRGIEEFKRVRRSSRHSLAILMIDIDKFKNVNDTYGHEAGDLLLKQIAARLKTNLREVDILGRIGGEEFAILLPDTSLKKASISAERVRKVIQNKTFQTTGAALTITVSIGVAAFNHNAMDIHSVLKNADIALYEAKSSGRNCVKLYEDIAGPNLLDQALSGETIKHHLH
jgi:diguanylate cyclase (GGDEF)-like protein/PAS domain S-box-containing protein